MGRPRKESSEIEMPASKDNLLEAPDLNPPAKRSHHKKVDKLSYEELQQKLARTFNFLSFVVKSKKSYQESDFIEEAKDLTRLAGKYELVNMGLTLLDPLFFLFGIFSKFRDMLKDRPDKPGKSESPAAGSASGDQTLRVINS